MYILYFLILLYFTNTTLLYHSTLHFISFCNYFLCTSCNIIYDSSEINELELTPFLYPLLFRYETINIIKKIHLCYIHRLYSITKKELLMNDVIITHDRYLKQNWHLNSKTMQLKVYVSNWLKLDCVEFMHSCHFLILKK